MNEGLGRLRERLNQIDRELLERAAERQDIVQQIGRLKAERGLATRDFERERQVLERARARAAALGLPPSLAERLMRELIRSSLERQEADRIAGISRDGDPALVLGGAGKMGRWFASFLSSQGYAAEVADPAATSELPVCEDWENRIDHYALIVVAAPIAATRELLGRLERLRPDGLIFDISSLKSPLRGRLRSLADSGLRVTSLHPMFGPDTTLLSGRHVICIDVGNASACEDAKALFAPTMVELVDMSLEDHDRMIGYVLGLSHALNIAFFTALEESGEAAGTLAKLSSTTFDAQLDIARRVASENPHLYFEIQALNDYRAAPLNALASAVERVRTLVDGQDEAGFVRLMEKGQAYLKQRRATEQ